MATKQKAKTALTFTKESFLQSERYANHRDLLSALLLENKTYTTEQVDKMIEKYLKGKVIQ